MAVDATESPILTGIVAADNHDKVKRFSCWKLCRFCAGHVVYSSLAEAAEFCVQLPARIDLQVWVQKTH